MLYFNDVALWIVFALTFEICRFPTKNQVHFLKLSKVFYTQCLSKVIECQQAVVKNSHIGLHLEQKVVDRWVL